MQKVVGSNPISRSDPRMPESDRKQAARKRARSSGRGVLRRSRGKSEEDAGTQTQEDAKAKPAAGSEKDEDGQLQVSSLLETTSEDVKQLLEAADEAAKKIREAAQTDAAGSKSAAESADGEGETGALIKRINTEVKQVLESADEAAEKIREEAHNEARQILEEARRRTEGATAKRMERVSELTEQVLGELSTVHGQLKNLQGAFDSAIAEMGGELAAEPSEVWQTKQNGAVESEEEATELRSRLGKRPRRKPREQPEGVSEGARLLALQQLMAGVEPETIEARLKDEFGIEDPKPILDWMGLHADPKSKPKKR
jgi:hypothetical protein